MFAGVVVSGGILGAYALPWLGFDCGGVVSGTIASAWQSSIGNVAAGSLFATLTSLGMNGYGVLMFGSVGAGLPLLASLAVKLDWCTCQYDKSKVIFVERFLTIQFAYE